MRNNGKHFVADENRELDLQLLDYGDIDCNPEDLRNAYHVTEEFSFNNGHYGNREDVVFLINGILVLVIECKNANKDEAIAIGVDQLRRYRDETPELMLPHGVELVGFDAPILYAMYLDKPLRDHTLLQAIARVNRPYENEAEEMVKPHGFVLDYVGIFKRLTKALAFDSEEINAIVKDIALLKSLYKTKMTKVAPRYLQLIERNFNDQDVDTLIEHFRDKERRKELFKEYKEIEMLYEIISPDAFLRPYR